MLKKTITKGELLSRLNELIQDRKSFLSKDEELNEIFLQDVETLEYARDIVEMYQFETLGYEAKRSD